MKFIKFREKGKRAFKFLTPSGGGNGLRVHAAQFADDKVDQVLRELREENPNMDFRAVNA